MLGISRFDELVDSLRVTRTVLTARLRLLVEEGVLDRVAYQERPERFDYRLTTKGRDLVPVLVYLMRWGDAHYPESDGPPRLVLHQGCGGEVDTRFHCSRCGSPLEIEHIDLPSGPGARRVATRSAA